MEAFGPFLDKFGPMGTALIVVCYVLYLLVTKVLPSVNAEHGERIKELIAAFREEMGHFHQKLEQSETRAEKRHDQIMDSLGHLHTKIDDMPAPPKDPKP